MASTQPPPQICANSVFPSYVCSAFPLLPGLRLSISLSSSAIWIFTCSVCPDIWVFACSIFPRYVSSVLHSYLDLCLSLSFPALFCLFQLSGSLSVLYFSATSVLPSPAFWITVCLSFFPSYLDLSLVWLSPVILICACFASPVIWICLCLHLSSPFILISVSFWPPQLYGSLWLFSPDVIPCG